MSYNYLISRLQLVSFSGLEVPTEPWYKNIDAKRIKPILAAKVYRKDRSSLHAELTKKKDYGQYIDKAKKDLVVCFIASVDMTGRNSGSPVIDANGNLIGLVFDGNYEGASHKLAYDKDSNRTICVDVRYVLWCIDKLGGASHIIKELKLVK